MNHPTYRYVRIIYRWIAMCHRIHRIHNINTIRCPLPRMWPYRIRLITRFVLAWATRSVSLVGQDLLILPEHLKLIPISWWSSLSLLVSMWCFVYSSMSVCLFNFLVMALLVYNRLISLNLPFVSFASVFILWNSIYLLNCKCVFPWFLEYNVYDEF